MCTTRIGKRTCANSLLGAIVALGMFTSLQADIGPNSLKAFRTSTDVFLTWDAGTGPYAVYRSTFPTSVAVPANLIGTTANTFHMDPLSGLPGSLYFYSVGNPPQCSSNPDCVDADACNGAETCNVPSGTCVAGTPLACSDGIACTTDSCNPASGCQYLPVDATCNDANECTTDTCSTSTGCGHTNVADGIACGGMFQTCQSGQCVFTCFAAGTPVRTKKGLTPIEQLKPGDMVATVFGTTGEMGFTPLRELEVRQAADLISVVIDDGEEIRVTGEHHFWVSGSRWVRARELTASDALQSFAAKPVAVRAVAERSTGRAVPVYNLRLDGAAAYFVGTAGVLTSSCHLTLNMSDLGPSAVAHDQVGVEGRASAGVPPLIVYDSKRSALTIRPAAGTGAAPVVLDGADVGAWAQRVGFKDGYVVVLDVEHRSLKLLSLQGMRSIVRSVPLRTEQIPSGAMIHDDLVFVSYFSGNQVEVYRWARSNDGPPDLAFVRRYSFDSSVELGLSGMAVIGDSLFVTGSGWVCRTPNCPTRFGRPHLFVVDLNGEPVGPFPDVTPSNLNPVAVYTHAPTSAAYLLNSGDSVGGYSSLQRLRGDGTLGPELRLPANARIGSAFQLDSKRFALLQMSGDHVFVIDAEHDRLEGVYVFDGARFAASSSMGGRVPDRNRAVLHDALPDPDSPDRFYLIDSKGKQLVKVRFGGAGGVETLGTTPLPAVDVPSWGVWLPE